MSTHDDSGAFLCPACSLEISPAARVCKYCGATVRSTVEASGSALPSGHEPMARAIPVKKPSRSPISRALVARVAATVCIAVLLVAAIFIVVRYRERESTMGRLRTERTALTAQTAKLKELHERLQPYLDIRATINAWEAVETSPDAESFLYMLDKVSEETTRARTISQGIEQDGVAVLGAPAAAALRHHFEQLRTAQYDTGYFSGRVKAIAANPFAGDPTAVGDRLAEALVHLRRAISSIEGDFDDAAGADQARIQKMDARLAHLKARNAWQVIAEQN